jgi:hypothetical protein
MTVFLFILIAVSLLLVIGIACMEGSRVDHCNGVKFCIPIDCAFDVKREAGYSTHIDLTRLSFVKLNRSDPNTLPLCCWTINSHEATGNLADPWGPIHEQ